MSLVQSLPAQNFSGTRCAQCGSNVSHTESTEAAQRRIAELEAQIRLLNAKAAAAADKLADYEDELHTLRARTQNPRPSTSASSATASPPVETGHPTPSQGHSSPLPPSAQTPSRLSSLSSLLPGRRTPVGSLSQHLQPDPTTNHSDSTSIHSLPTVLPTTTSNTAAIQSPLGSPDSASKTLASMLQAETKARLAAESSLSQANSELEELTAQLFGQANEMVANERKARAKLEERVEVLEKRDGEKRGRLERLEKAVGRIERVRGMLA